MTYRIAIGEIAHETNTFCAEPTPVEPFKHYSGSTARRSSRRTRATAPMSAGCSTRRPNSG